MATEPLARQEFSFSITSEDKGKMTYHLFDRITPDDVMLHLVKMEIARIIAGEDQGVDVPQNFKDFLIKLNFTAGQN
jgi:hypothetical protein